ncbi:MAG: D-alanyl-D-alanine carboxypeptidase family protein [Solirubrobacterales bacterium]
MTTGVRRALCVLAALAALSTAPAQAAAQGGEGAPSPDARAWVLVDASDGDRLAGRSISSTHSIASTTKLMTAYLALRELPLERRIAAPDYQPISPAETLANLAPGERVSVNDLLHALLLGSANDAAVTLAEGVSGSVPRFVREMNQAAAALGLTDTHYENPIGLDSARNHSSAGDLASLTIRLRRDPVFRQIVDTERAVLRTGDRVRQITNRNALLLRFPWVSGVKTGHTLDAGYVLVGSGTRKGATLVSVVLGTASEAARDAATLELLEYGFSLYRRETAVAAGETIASPELRYQGETLPLAAEGDLRVSVRRGERVDTEVRAPSEVEGPIERGERLGKVTVTVDGRDAGEARLVAARGADEATVLEQARGRVPLAAILIAIGVVAIAIGVVGARRAARRGGRRDEERMRSEEERMRRRDQERVSEGAGER